MKRLPELPKPVVPPPLDHGFRPPILADRAFRQKVKSSGNGVPLVIAVERADGGISRTETKVLDPEHPDAFANCFYVERLVKFLLWQWGGWKITLGGSTELARFIQFCYSQNGMRSFDADLWGNHVCKRDFLVECASPEDVPEETEDTGSQIDVNWKGWRIGFDLGASDRKVAVVKDGRLALKNDGSAILSKELPWNPRKQSDPKWHFRKIMEILKLAKSEMHRYAPGAAVEAIGGSSAGVYVNGCPRIASIFRGVKSRSEFEKKVVPIFRKIEKEWGVPFRLENDGDVTALAGSISLNDGAVLGLAMGSSLAAGYVDDRRRVRGWMNELAFAPVDFQPGAPADEWSGDRGVGANYFSQQAVGRLIPQAGIKMDDISEHDLPGRLERVQELMENGDEQAEKIYRTIGSYLGYTIPYLCDRYRPVRHVEILGRVMTGKGGQIILEQAEEVLQRDFQETASDVSFYEPDEREKRHGQAEAAASLPSVE